MSFKHILVHLDGTPHTGKRVDVAVSLAKRFSAHLTGVFAQALPDTQDMLPAAQVTASTAEADTALAALQEKAEAAGVPSNVKIIPAATYSQLSKHLTYAARDCDLVVMGQHDEKVSKGECPDDLVETIIDHCGRPVLVIPYAGTFEHIGERVLIGWNGTRESSRALNDAMPLIREAQAVTLLSINPPKTILAKHEEYNAGILQHLSIYGVTAKEIHEANTDVAVGSLLVNRLADEGADLLVLGAHHHTGLAQKFKGSVARDLLRQLTVPAILSH